MIILKCKLKPEKPNGSVVYLEKRVHGKEFEIINPGIGCEHNVKKWCYVEVVDTEKTVIEKEVVIEEKPVIEEEIVIEKAKKSKPKIKRKRS